MTEQVPEESVHLIGLNPEVLEKVTVPVGIVVMLARRFETTAVQMVCEPYFRVVGLHETLMVVAMRLVGVREIVPFSSMK